jgi:hypothetical protein
MKKLLLVAMILGITVPLRAQESAVAPVTQISMSNEQLTHLIAAVSSQVCDNKLQNQKRGPILDVSNMSSGGRFVVKMLVQGCIGYLGTLLASNVTKALIGDGQEIKK